MKYYLIMVILVLVTGTHSAQVKINTTLSQGADLLFKNSKSKLTNDEKNSVYQQLNLTLSKNKKAFMLGTFEVTVLPYITDMNTDGLEEIFVVMQSIALYGNVGERFLVFIKNANGKYEVHSELGNGIAMILNSKTTGYPDIAVGGPGFEFPAYRWDGKKYKLYKKIKDADLQSKKIKYIDIAEYSKVYQNGKN